MRIQRRWRDARRAGPAVVGLGRGWGVGSGVVIAPGRVLTNAHNLRHDEIAVTFDDGRHAAGSVAGADADLDLAVISVDTAEIAALEWVAPTSGRKSRKADRPTSDRRRTGRRLGRFVIALANPGGRGLRVTQGFVSGGARASAARADARLPGAIEHTAPLPRGSSGGPLLDATATCWRSTPSASTAG